jgi:hypothetical protein
MKSLTFIEIDVPSFTPANPEEIVTYRFAQAADYLPPEIDAIPSIQSVSFTPATISLGENLGQRASLKIVLSDHRHIFAGEPYAQGTFWGKWRARYGTRLRGRPLRLIRGLLGQGLQQMETRHYLIEATDGPTLDALYTIEAKDALKLADDDRAQAPRLSNGRLAGSIDAVSAVAILTPAGIGDAEYPASGHVCIGGKEIAGFVRAGDTLTISRGELGSTAIAHDAGDRVQLALRYPGNDVAEILNDLLTGYAATPASYIPLADWQAETAAHLGVIYAATITEPTSVKKLIAELIHQAALALWWDDLAQKIRLQVLREIATDADIFDAGRIIEGSLKVAEQPNKRISQTWVYYGQRDPTDNADKEDNYRAALANVDLERETEYGSAEIVKIQGRWIETLSAAERLAQIQLSRFRDPPRSFAFDLFTDQIVALASGYQVRWWGNQDESGLELPARIQITRISRESDRIHIEAEEMLASGVVVLTHTVLLLDTSGLLNWQVPASWNNAENSIAALGGGGGGDGGGGTLGGRGGGGGAFSRVSNVVLTPGALIPYRIGAGGAGGDNSAGNAGSGGDSWFGAASFAAAIVAAKGGQAGNGRTGGGLGGEAAQGIGALKTSGGDGGNGANRKDERGGGGGGGGAGGPNGDGGNGGDGGTDNGSGAGGGGADGGFAGQSAPASSKSEPAADGGNNRFGYGGGTAANPTGRDGGGGRGGDGNSPAGTGGTGEQLYTQTEAPITSAGAGGGGGGGRENSSTRLGGRGGRYGGGGGGGGGSSGGGGEGYQGFIAITWKEA